MKKYFLIFPAFLLFTVFFVAPAQADITTGLVGWWKFDGNALDSSGNDNNGILIGGPTFTTGQIDQALNFDGNNDYVDAGAPPTLNNLPALTISAWIKPDSLTNPRNIIVAKTHGVTPTFTGWVFYTENESAGKRSLQFEADFNEGSSPFTDLMAVSEKNVINVGEWNHMVVTWDGSKIAANVKFYVNGALVGHNTSGSGNHDVDGIGTRSDDSYRPLAIGNDAQSSPYTGFSFDGLIDDVRIYNRVLSECEILELNGLECGKIIVEATLDGQPWSGPLYYTLTGPENLNGTAAPTTFSDVPADMSSYTLTYQSGGPGGAIYSSISPVSSQPLPNGNSILFTINFTTPGVNDKTVSVCTALVDLNGTIIDGATEPGTQFSVLGIPPNGFTATQTLPDSYFNAPINFNRDIFGGDGIEDAECRIYPAQNGAYGYYEEVISPSANWQTPLYNDQYTIAITSPSDFFQYIYNSGDPIYVNSNGVINIDNASLRKRTVVVLNRLNYSVGTVNAIVQRVGADETISSAPPDTIGRIDNVANIDNPSNFGGISLGSHTAYASDVPGHTISAGTCRYNIGGTECNVPSYSISCPSASCVLDNGFWGVPANIQVGRVRKVEFKYSDLPFDYNLSDSGTSYVTKASSDAFTTNTITKTLISGTGSVDLTVSGLPSGVSLEGISSQGCALTCQSIITLKVTPSAPVGTFPITVTGSPLNKQTSFNLVISGDPLTVSCSASPTTALLGETVTLTANISGGIAPYVYSWDGTDIPTMPSPNTNPFNVSYNTVGQKNISVTVTDSSSPPLQTTCPIVTVRANIYPQYEEF